MAPRGNPNPSPATRFKPGQSGNPSGKSAAHQKAEHRAAEISAILRAAALSSLQEKVKSGEISALDAISGDMLRLFRDSEDRAHGTPKQSVDLDASVRGVVSTVPLTPEQWAAQHSGDDD